MRIQGVHRVVEALSREFLNRPLEPKTVREIERCVEGSPASRVLFIGRGDTVTTVS